jgi:hypothetical protein
MGFEEEPGSIEDEVDDGAARVTDGSPPTPWDLRYIRPCKQAAIAHFRSMLILRLAASKKSREELSSSDSGHGGGWVRRGRKREVSVRFKASL